MLQLVAATQHVAALAHHRPGALLAGQRRALLDAVERRLGRAPEDGEHAGLAQAVHAVVAPLAGGDQAALGVATNYGALNLYLDFINLFQMLLSLLGNRR